MHIRADHTKCRGIGLCEAAAPSLFTVADDGLVAVLNATPSEEERDQAESAIANCPTLTLSLHHD
ncbi:ferredoxin [[Mycobacterium] wendilense]|uniref:Ferredoxin n=1 Tax=[Mycobacterium] wendilense TaxID=3064284 RepID=A0ABN9P6R0_9MYCO|nr:ferredoxin [Mycolicibacterium sp. MU0050]CAJ1586852.1 ferredoxin [Mycolicibacterium sp. MU0050]